MYSRAITANDLWENITHIMTDSVSKNLKTEDLVAEKLGCKHIPYHLLCKSHVVEKLGASNLDVLAAFEERVKLRQRLEAINPALNPSFRGKKTVVVAGVQVGSELFLTELQILAYFTKKMTMPFFKLCRKMQSRAAP